MDGSVTPQRTRSPPIRPARPEVGTDNVSYGRPSAEHFTSVTVAAQQAQAQPQADGEGSTDTTPKPRKRKSARYSIGNGNSTGADGAERKGSIRNAVRRLFGRKSKGDIPEVPALPRTEASRHGYHKSVSLPNMLETRSCTNTDLCRIPATSSDHRHSIHIPRTPYTSVSSLRHWLLRSQAPSPLLSNPNTRPSTGTTVQHAHRPTTIPSSLRAPA